MKRLLTLTLALFCLVPLFAQQKLSLFGIANKWREMEYVVCAPGGNTHDVSVCMDCFSGVFIDNPMMRALNAYFSADSDAYKSQVDDFTLDMKNGYVRIRMKSDELVETEGKFWALPDGRELFVVKMINPDEDTLPRIFFFDVINAEGVMKPANEPAGLNYGFADGFILPRTGNSIEVYSEYFPSDHIVLENGEFVYKEFAPNAIAAYVNDPDPSGLTNIRATPGGQVIGRIGDPANYKNREQEEEDYYDDEDWDVVLHIFNPTNGWWEILNRVVDGIPIKDHAWIHYSVMEAHTRNYDGSTLNLYESPDASSKVVGRIREEMMSVHPMDISEDGKWVKVKCAAGTGWLETSWLCANTLTNCS